MVDKEKKAHTIYERDEETRKLVTKLSSTIMNYEQYRFPAAFNHIKNKVLFAGDMQAILRKSGAKGFTAEIHPLTDSVHDAYLSNLIDIQTMPRVIATRSEYIKEAQAGQDFEDWALDVSGSGQIHKLIYSEAILLGTSYGMASWEQKNEEITIPKTDKDGKKTGDQKIKINVNRPLTEYVSFFELFTDISANDFYKTRRKARRKIMSIDSVVSKYKSFYDFTEEDEKKMRDTMGSAISTKDYTRIYDIKNYEHLYDNTDDNTLLSAFMNDNVLNAINEDDLFVEVIEVYTKEKLQVLINGHLYVDSANPYPYGDPFAVVVYEKQPGTYLGRGIGEKLAPFQRQASMLHSSIKDAMMQNLKPMYVAQKSALKDPDGTTPSVIEYVPGKVFEVEEQGSFQTLSLSNTHAIELATNQLNSIIAQAYEAIGTNSYVQGGQGKVERSLGAANLKVAVAMTRLKPLNASIESFHEKIFQNRLILASIKMDDDEEISVMGKDGREKFVKITPSDIVNKVKITVDIDSLREMTKDMRTKGALELLNAVAPFNIDPVSQAPYLSPRKIIDFVTGELDYDLSSMTDEERYEYMKENIDLATSLQPQQPQGGGAPDGMGGPIPEELMGVEGGQQTPMMPTETTSDLVDNTIPDFI